MTFLRVMRLEHDMGFLQEDLVDIVAPWWGFWLLETLFAFDRVKKKDHIFW